MVDNLARDGSNIFSDDPEPRPEPNIRSLPSINYITKYKTNAFETKKTQNFSSQLDFPGYSWVSKWGIQRGKMSNKFFGSLGGYVSRK